MQRCRNVINYTRSQKKMTTDKDISTITECPAEGLLKSLSGKWKPQIFRFAAEGALRFNSLIRQLPGSSRQAVAVALKELEEAGLLERNVVQLKPLHVEYTLSEKGRLMIPVFQQLEGLNRE